MTPKSSSAGSPAAGDDRNLVPADAAGGPSLEDRLFLYWKENRTLLIGLVVVVIFAFVGWELWGVMQARKQASISAAYGAAATLDAKRQFVREHPDHPLTGVALLEIADDAYANARYEEAGRDYAEAAGKLQEPALLGRARLGEAMAALQAGLASKGEPALRNVANDATLPDTLRAQAWYQMAVFALAGGEHDKAREALDQVSALDAQGFWGFRGMMLREDLPAEEPLAPAAGAPVDAPSSSETAAP